MENYRKIIHKYKKDFFRLNHVVGIGFGIKEKKGIKTKEQAIIILVDQKLPMHQIKKRDLIPQSVGEYQTDVIEIGEIKFLDNRKNRMRPAQPGISIGHYKISAGTLGAIVKDKKTRKPMILSNNHVLANITNGRDNRAQIGDPILQPGSYDKGNKTNDVIGYLERFIPLNKGEGAAECQVAIAVERFFNFFIHLLRPNYNMRFFKNEGSNLVDCALARPSSDQAVSNDIIGVGQVQGVKEAAVGMKVQKSGRSSGLTNGSVVAIGSSVSVNMGDSEVAVFDNQFVTTPISKSGDSGSLVLDMGNNAVGLLFAGSEKATVCNRIQNVLNLLKIEF